MLMRLGSVREHCVSLTAAVREGLRPPSFPPADICDNPSGVAACMDEGEGCWIAAGLSPQGEEVGPADTKHSLHFNSGGQSLGIRVEQEGDQLIRETSVNLTCGGSLLKHTEGTQYRCAVLN